MIGLVDNPRCIALKSHAAQAGYLIAGITILIHSLPALAKIWGWSPDFIGQVQATWDVWFIPVVTAAGPAFGRIIKQPSMGGTTS